MGWQILFIFLLFYFLFPSVSFASRSISITSDKNSLVGDETMALSASLSGFTNSENIYLKAAFFKEGSTNYFGYIRKEDIWIKNSVTAAEQKQVTIGNWDGNVLVKSDFSDTGFSVDGQYNFKLGFYYITSGGNLSSVNWSDVLAINLTKGEEPSPTTTMPSEVTLPKAQSTTSVKSPTPKSNIVKYAPTPYLSKSVSITASNRINNNNFAKIADDFKKASTYANLKIKRNAIVSPSPIIEVLGAKKRLLPNFTLIGGFLFLLLALGYFSWGELKRRRII